MPNASAHPLRSAAAARAAQLIQLVQQLDKITAKIADELSNAAPIAPVSRINPINPAAFITPAYQSARQVDSARPKRSEANTNKLSNFNELKRISKYSPLLDAWSRLGAVSLTTLHAEAVKLLQSNTSVDNLRDGQTIIKRATIRTLIHNLIRARKAIELNGKYYLINYRSVHPNLIKAPAALNN